MKLHQLKELVRQVVREEEDYQQLFKHMLDKSGKSIPSMSDDDKKKFFNAVDTAYKAKSEGRLRGYNENLPGNQEKLDTDKDGEIEASDLATLRASKNESVNEGTNEEWAGLDTIKRGGYGSSRLQNGDKIRMVIDARKNKYYNGVINGSSIKWEDGAKSELSLSTQASNRGDLQVLRPTTKNESINEEEIRWNAVENAIINFLKMNTKILDKRVKDRDTDGVKGGLQSIIDGLTNAQRSLKLK